METVCSSETLVSTYKTTQRFYPEDQHRHIHRRENLKSYISEILQKRTFDATTDYYYYYYYYYFIAYRTMACNKPDMTLRDRKGTCLGLLIDVSMPTDRNAQKKQMKY
jgi:hypothetical protein